MSGRSYFSRERRIERQAHRWVLQMIDDPERHTANVVRWINRSPEHRAAYLRVITEIGYASDSAVLMPTLRATDPNAFVRPRWQRPPSLAAAGAIAGVLLLAAAWHVQPTGIGTMPDARTQVQTASIAGGEKAFRLADGSMVTLLGATMIRIRFGAEERAIDLLNGRARFKVTHDRARPFVVYAKGGSVTAVGTLFEVSIERDVQVRLLEGRVRVVMPPQPGQTMSREVQLAPGQTTSFISEPDPAPQAVKGASQTPGRSLTTFDDAPVSVIVEEVNRRSATKIELTDPAIAQQKIFAELNLDDADAVARKIAASLALTIDRSRPGRIRLFTTH